jgi:hypothetical protein
MATLVFVAIPVNLALIWLLNGWIVTGGEVGEPISTRRVAYAFVVLLGLAGALGSIISILVRIKDFTEIRILNPPALFWTGFFKPIIGAAFSLFVFCAFAAGLINVTSGVNQRFMFLTLGFIAGFSERFAPDLVSGIERTISIGSGPPPAEPPKPSGSGNS